MINMRNILVVSPHGDDETISMGGTIAKLSKDCVVSVLILTIPQDETETAEKLDEIYMALDILGVKNRTICNLKPTKLIESKEDVKDLIEGEIIKNQIDTLFLPQIDLHPDHKICFGCGFIVAYEPIFVKNIICYETPTTKHAEPFAPNLYVNITEQWGVKSKALMQCVSQIKDYPAPRSIKGLAITARARGLEVGVEYVEAFRIIRSVI